MSNPAKNRLLLIQIFFSLVVIIIFISPRILSSNQQKPIKLHINEYDSYSLMYPSNWYIYPAHKKGDVTILSNKDIETHDLSRLLVNVIVFDNTELLNLQNFTLKHDEKNRLGIGESISISEVNTFSLNKRQHLKRSISNEEGAAWEMFIANGDKIYLISSNIDPDQSTEISSIVKSIIIGN